MSATNQNGRRTRRIRRSVQLFVAELGSECPLNRIVDPSRGDAVVIAQQLGEPMEALVDRVAIRIAALEREGRSVSAAQLFSGPERGVRVGLWRLLMARLLANAVRSRGSLSLSGALLMTAEGLMDTWELVERLLPRVARGVLVHVRFPNA